MKNILLVMIMVAFSSPAFSGHHEGGDGLNLKKRQADAVMTVTNVDIGCLLYTSDACRRYSLCRSRWSPYH